MIIKDAVFYTSVVNAQKILNDNIPEFAFVGRSNVGKSSFINKLVNKKNLANLFRFVDLPGYGFAKVGQSHLNIWSSLIDVYLKNSKNLLTVFVLIDVRHEPTILDKQMIDYLIFNNLSFMIIATKVDKISKQKLKIYLNQIAKTLNVREEMIIATSSKTGEGTEKILNYIKNKLESYYE